MSYGTLLSRKSMVSVLVLLILALVLVPGLGDITRALVLDLVHWLMTHVSVEVGPSALGGSYVL